MSLDTMAAVRWCSMRSARSRMPCSSASPYAVTTCTHSPKLLRELLQMAH